MGAYIFAMIGILCFQIVAIFFLGSLPYDERGFARGFWRGGLIIAVLAAIFLFIKVEMTQPWKTTIIDASRGLKMGEEK